MKKILLFSVFILLLTACNNDNDGLDTDYELTTSVSQIEVKKGDQISFNIGNRYVGNPSNIEVNGQFYKVTSGDENIASIVDKGALVANSTTAVTLKGENVGKTTIHVVIASHGRPTKAKKEVVVNVVP